MRILGLVVDVEFEITHRLPGREHLFSISGLSVQLGEGQAEQE